ncbi:MAG: hypothetical protein C0502_04125 [Opitutus sp.]|nr:hypothetical protein [Opitutus sp.]
MILSAIIGISIVSYINVGRSSLTMSNRSLYNNGAMNLAENGLEEAMYSINKLVADPSYSFTSDGWTAVGTSDMRRKWTGTAFDQNATGEVRVYIYNYTVAPRIIARSLVSLGGQASSAVEKWIEVQLRKTSKFANGLVAKDSIRFSGNNASVDSWNSKLYPSTTTDTDGDGTVDALDTDANGDGVADASIPYSSGVRRDNGSVGSVSVSVDAVLVQNADIWGYAATGGALPTVGSNGLVGPFGTATGTMDMSRVSTDFSASFDPVTAPTTGSNIASIASSDLPMTLGTAGTTNVYRLPSITGTGGAANVLTIQGNTTLVLTAAPGTTAIQFTGNAGIAIATGANLTIYVEGDVNIGGNGVANGGTTAATSNPPSNFQIWGTRTSGTQNVSIAGNGVLSAIAYVPNGNLSINGNGDVMGSFVADDITVTGNASFHYDESLGNFGGNNPYRVSRWNELSEATARATYSSVMNF